MSLPSQTSPASSRGSSAVDASDVLGEIQRIASSELEVTRILALEDRLVGELELDSMGLTVLAVGLEDRYRIRLGEEDASELSTVGDLVALVQRRVQETPAS